MAGGGRLFRRLFLDLHPQKSMGFIKMHFLSPAALCPVHLLRDLSVAVGGAALSAGLGQPWVRRAPLGGRGAGSHGGERPVQRGAPLPSQRGRHAAPALGPFAGLSLEGALTSIPTKRLSPPGCRPSLGGTHPQIKLRSPLRSGHGSAYT